MAKEYIFILGRDPELSILEIKSYLEARNVKYRIIEQSDKALVVNLPPLNFKKVINDLGGTSKIARVIDLGKEEVYLGVSNKIRYTISCYSEVNGEVVEAIKDALKDKFKQEKIKAMFEKAGKKQKYMDASQLLSKKILSQGFELVIFGDRIAKTIAAYNPKEYKKRDLGKPAQRPLHTISVRLAKILINLSGAKEGDTLIDPFCGIGVVLQEAMMMGINVKGMDIERNCVRDSLKNIEWTKIRYNTKAKYKVMQGDSSRDLYKLKGADALATEPYLGPFLKKIPMKDKALKIIRELKPLYQNVLKDIKKVVKDKSVIIVPRFRLYSGERVKMDFLSLAKRARLRPTKESPIIYASPGSKIEREIWILK